MINLNSYSSCNISVSQIILGRVQRKIEKDALDKGSWSGGQQVRADVVLAEDRSCISSSRDLMPPFVLLSARHAYMHIGKHLNK